MLGVAIILIGMAFVFGDLFNAARDYFSGSSASAEWAELARAASGGHEGGLADRADAVGLGVLLLVVLTVGSARLGDGTLNRVLFGLGIGALIAVFGYSIMVARQTAKELDHGQRQRVWRTWASPPACCLWRGSSPRSSGSTRAYAFTEQRPDALASPCYKETNYFCIKVVDVDPSVDPHTSASWCWTT